MIEKVHQFSRIDSGVMEKIIDEDHVNINHIIVAPGAAVPVHVANSHVHQIVIRGTLSLSLEDGPEHNYPAGNILAVPFNTKMAIRNGGIEPLEFFVVKSPNPRSMPPTKKI